MTWEYTSCLEENLVMVYFELFQICPNLEFCPNSTQVYFLRTRVLSFMTAVKLLEAIIVRP